MPSQSWVLRARQKHAAVCLGALERPQAARHFGWPIIHFQLKQKELAAFQKQQIGFVFQDHCRYHSAPLLKNVLTPTLVAAVVDSYESRARELLDQVGLVDRLETSSR